MEIEIASVLGTMCDQFTNMSGVDIGTIGKGRLHDPHTHPVQYVQDITNLWLAGFSSRPPTWRLLLQVIQDLGHLELREQIEAFLKGLCNFTSINQKPDIKFIIN